MTDETSLRQAYLQIVTEPRAGARPGCPSGEALLAVVERTGPEAGRLQVMEHVMQCAACRRELELLKSAIAAATEAGAVDSGDPRVQPIAGRQRFPMRTFAAAAGIVFVIGVGVIVRNGVGGPDEGGEPRFRSPGRPQVILVPPVASPDGRVLLQWRSVPNAVIYRVDVFDAGGATVTTATVRDTTFSLDASVTRSDSLRYVITAVQADAGEVTSSPGAVRH